MQYRKAEVKKGSHQSTALSSKSQCAGISKHSLKFKGDHFRFKKKNAVVHRGASVENMLVTPRREQTENINRFKKCLNRFTANSSKMGDYGELGICLYNMPCQERLKGVGWGVPGLTKSLVLPPCSLGPVFPQNHCHNRSCVWRVEGDGSHSTEGGTSSELG